MRIRHQNRTQILARAKRLDTDEWVFGYFVELTDTIRSRKSYRIYTGASDLTVDGDSPLYYEVYPGTKSLFTGMLDSHGDKIFEGDIVNTRGGIGAVAYFPTTAQFLVRIPGEKPWYPHTGKVEIIGNRWDNMDLLDYPK